MCLYTTFSGDSDEQERQRDSRKGLGRLCTEMDTMTLHDQCEQAIGAIPIFSNKECEGCENLRDLFAAGLEAAINAAYGHCYSDTGDSPRRVAVEEAALGAFVRRVNAI